MFQGNKVSFVVVTDTTTQYGDVDPLASKGVAKWVENRNAWAVQQSWDEVDPVNFYVDVAGKVTPGMGWDRKGRWNKGVRITPDSGVRLDNALVVMFLGAGHRDFTEAAAKALRKLLDEVMETRPEFQRVVMESDVVPDSRGGGVDLVLPNEMPSLARWVRSGMIPWWSGSVQPATVPNVPPGDELETEEEWQERVAAEMRTVGLGDTGDSVEVLRILLREYGDASDLPVSANFDEETESAVARIQATHKLEGERGVADEEVWRFLLGMKGKAED
jgi:hypothetical protein